MLTIWGRTNSVNVQKVMWAVGELELPHRRIDAGGAFGGLDTAEYGTMNPNRRIPVIRDGETVVWESNACVRYLADRYGKGGLCPEDPGARARADMWMDWMITTVQPHLHVCFWGLVRTPEADRDMAAIAAAARSLGAVWQVLDEWMSERRFVAGAELTMGDIPLGCAFYRYMNLDMERPELHNLQLWYQNLKARDAFRHHVMIPVT